MSDGDEGLWFDDYGPHHNEMNVEIDAHGGPDAVDVGVLFGIGGYFMDRHAEKIIDGVGARGGAATLVPEEPKTTINAAEDNKGEDLTWDEFIGQENLKRQLRTHIESAKIRGVALEHTLLASGRPGVGKTTMGRIIAQEMGGGFFMLVPPFHRQALNDAVCQLEDGDILFIDEIHKLADHGKAQAENLLHIMEDGALYLDWGRVPLNDITIIGATTDADKLPETIIDRFMVKPHFEDYSPDELIEITRRFEKDHSLFLPMELRRSIAQASRRTPRVIRELVIACRDLVLPRLRDQGLDLEHPPLDVFLDHGDVFPTSDELLEFKAMTREGLTPVHREYITGIYHSFGRTTSEGERIYVAGEMSLVTMMRMPKQGLARLERELIEVGLVDRTPQGRKLTPKGIQKAREWSGR